MQYLISGLLVSAAAAVLLAFINSAIHSKIHAWLHALEAERPAKADAVHERAIVHSFDRLAKWSLWGWMFLAGGFVLQIVAVLIAQYPTKW